MRLCGAQRSHTPCITNLAACISRATLCGAAVRGHRLGAHRGGAARPPASRQENVADALRTIAAPWSALTPLLAAVVRRHRRPHRDRDEPLSAKDLLLNLLAIAFITEADDMLAMLLSPAERRRPDKALEEMRKSGVVVDGMVFARFVALACSVSIVLFVVYAEFFLNTLGIYWLGVQRNGRRFIQLRILGTFFRSSSIFSFTGSRFVQRPPSAKPPCWRGATCFTMGGLLLWFERSLWPPSGLHSNIGLSRHH